MGLLHLFDALGGGDDVHEGDGLAAIFLDKGDGVGRGAAGGQHGIDHEDLPLGDIGGHLAVILHRLVGLRIPEEADVADFRRGHQVNDGVHHAEASPENGHDGQLLAREHFHLGGGDGRLHLALLGGQIAGCLIAHKGCNFPDNFPEFLHAGILVAENGQLVLQQRVIQNVYSTHKFILFLALAFFVFRVRPGSVLNSWE